MKIFLDTEFTDFPESECDLISIGLVDDNGRYFYAELTDYRQEACSSFVKEVVLPLLNKHPDRILGNKLQVAYKLAEWLEEYRNEDECVICFDYNTDWVLMNNVISLLDTDAPDFLTTKNIWGDLNPLALEYFWLEQDAFDWKQHMALYDAIGNRYAYRGE
jgi:hypothetical protein